MNCCEAKIEEKAAPESSLQLCSACGRRGQKVRLLTLRHLLRGERQKDIRDAHYYFCASPDCDAVYFSKETNQLFTQKDVRVRIGIKDKTEPVTICYCFGFTEQMMRDEILALGYTAIPELIKAEINAGHCACEIKNPSGRCCLGEVNTSVKRIEAQLQASQADA
ncbi:MAG: hypothetical protein AB1631_05665 [Acidobacteriota bacterium]